MAKGFKGKSPLDNLEKVEDSPVEDRPAEKNAAQETEKRKPGRPSRRTEQYKPVSVQLPVRLVDQWREVSEVTGSMSEYLTRLIERDMRSNYDAYKEMVKLRRL